MPRTRKRPNCYIVAGSNGAGKTTFATEFLPQYANCGEFINADLIARGLSPFDANAALVRAGRLVLERIRELGGRRADFAFETTLSGRSYVSVLHRLRAAGYRIHMFYVWIPNPELAILRIRERVREGGHHVPSRDVRRRYGRTLVNLFSLYRPFLHTLRIYDNSTSPRLIFEDLDGKIMEYDAILYRKMVFEAMS